MSKLNCRFFENLEAYISLWIFEKSTVTWFVTSHVDRHMFHQSNYARIFNFLKLLNFGHNLIFETVETDRLNDSRALVLSS